MGVRIYVGNIDPKLSERDIEDEFRRFGSLRSVWVARNPPGFAFLEFDDSRDADDAIRKMDGVKGWRVEHSRGGPRGGGGGGDRGGGGGGGGDRGRGGDMRCYECNEVGHLARDCRVRQARLRGSPVRGGRSRSRERSRRRSRTRSRSRGRSDSRSPRKSYSRSRSRSPSRSRSRSRGRR